MADWSDLVYHLLEHITSFLSLPDHHRCSAVCKNWRFIAKQKRHSPAPQLPWLVLGEDQETKKRKFYSPSEEKHYSIDIPELCGRYIGGSSHGWLFAIDIKITCILINPFTREFHELPQFPPFSGDVDVTTLIEEVPSDYTHGPRNYTFKEMQRFIIEKGILSHDPKVRSDFTAMILFGQKNTPAIWRPGDTTWTVIKGPSKAMKDVTYLNGNFYVISAMNILYVVDLESDPKMIEIEPRIRPCVCEHRYLVSFKGFLVLIERFQKVIERGHYDTEDFMLLEIDLERKELHGWDDIDQCTIFLGVNSPIVIDASQFAGCKENAFYFTDLPCPYSAKFGCRDLGVFDCVTKTITTYYPPEIFHPLVAPPVWLDPNPWLQILWVMADWSDLVYHLLEHITSFLSLPDHHRFSSVCKNWRFVAKQKRHSPAPQLPWLVLGEDRKTKKRKFYSLSKEKHYSIDIPELCGRYISGSSHGWLFAIDIKITCILINPFTREFHELPQFPPFSGNVDVTTLIEEVPSDYTHGPRNYTFKEMQRDIVEKGILSHDPKVRSDFTAMILFGQKNTPAIWRPGDTTWTVIKGPGKAMKDVTYLNGNFYVISGMNILYVVDLGSDPKMIEIEPRIRPCVCEHRYLVSFKGFLVLIERFQKVTEMGHYNTEEFMLLEIDLEQKELHGWDDIDRCAIFLGVNSPIVINASQFARCKGNAFYFTDLPCPNSAKFGCRDLGVFDYVTKTVTTYYPPEIFHPLVASPVWLTPNPW